MTSAKIVEIFWILVPTAYLKTAWNFVIAHFGCLSFLFLFSFCFAIIEWHGSIEWTLFACSLGSCELSTNKRMNERTKSAQRSSEIVCPLSKHKCLCTNMCVIHLDCARWIVCECVYNILYYLNVLCYLENIYCHFTDVKWLKRWNKTTLTFVNNVHTYFDGNLWSRLWFFLSIQFFVRLVPTWPLLSAITHTFYWLQSVDLTLQQQQQQPQQKYI